MAPTIAPTDTPPTELEDDEVEVAAPVEVKVGLLKMRVEVEAPAKGVCEVREEVTVERLVLVDVAEVDELELVVEDEEVEDEDEDVDVDEAEVVEGLELELEVELAEAWVEVWCLLGLSSGVWAAPDDVLPEPLPPLPPPPGCVLDEEEAGPPAPESPGLKPVICLAFNIR